MSYSLGITDYPQTELLQKVEAEIGEINDGNAFDHTPGMKEAVADHLALLLDLAHEVIASGVVVKEGHRVNITIAGHANPDHEPLGFWSNDFLTLTISQAPSPCSTEEPA